MLGDLALAASLNLPVRTVLDVGSGPGLHAEVFKEAKKAVVTLDLHNADINGDFLDCSIPYVDLIWCCHVLEHQPNPGLFLQKILHNCEWAAITVPTAKDLIVGGHLTIWNAGLLLYNMILAGFDCSEAKVKTYGYNISVITQTKKRPHVDLKMDYGDIKALSKYFPFDAVHGFDGRIEELNW